MDEPPLPRQHPPSFPEPPVLDQLAPPLPASAPRRAASPRPVHDDIAAAAGTAPAHPLRRALVPLGVLGALLLKFKGVLLVVLKFLPAIFKTGGTMILSIGAYAMAWGWQYALGFVLLIFVHECGHLVAARRLGLKVGAPVFIPFMGAFIALKDAPRNAWIEAQVGIGGPLLGSLGALACLLIYYVSANPLFGALAFTGFFLNLFNLAPAGFLDGGRIVTALSPWLWVVGVIALGAMLVRSFLHHEAPNFVLVLVFLFSLPRLFSLFRSRTEEERRYFEVTPGQRALMGGLYFGLIGLLFAGMNLTHTALAPVR